MTTTILKELIGKTFTSVSRNDTWKSVYLNEHNDGILLKGTENYGLFHSQDCCESVGIVDITGDLSDLEGTPMLVAEERHDNVPPESDYGDVKEWTFFEFRTIKGSVTIKFEGTSNGYYGTSANLHELKSDES